MNIRQTKLSPPSPRVPQPPRRILIVDNTSPVQKALRRAARKGQLQKVEHRPTIVAPTLTPKQVPHGYKLQYRMFLRLEADAPLPESVRRQFLELDAASYQKFNRRYDNLTVRQKSDLHAHLNSIGKAAHA